MKHTYVFWGWEHCIVDSPLMGYDMADIVQDCIDVKMHHPEDRLCAADEWKEILLSWMQECTGEEGDRFLRLHKILQRCIHDT